MTPISNHATVSSVREAESTSTSPSPSRSMPNTENAPSVAIEMTFEPSAACGPEGGKLLSPLDEDSQNERTIQLYNRRISR